MHRSRIDYLSALRWLPPVLASAMIAMVASVLPGQQLLIVADDGTTGLAFRAQVGRAVTFVCPSTIVANGRVWGTDSYLDESPVCTAAIHAGVLTRGTSGQVTILISDEGQSFQGTRRNGVTSVDNGPWTSSYFEISGTDVYTSQSAICVAAVHAGVITRDGGGPISVVPVAKQASFPARERNGVTSTSWGDPIWRSYPQPYRIAPAVADVTSKTFAGAVAGGPKSAPGGAAITTRTIPLAGFTASGTAVPIVPRTISLGGFSAAGIAGPIVPRTIRLEGWTFVGVPTIP